MALTKIGRLVDKGIVKDQTNLGAEAADTDEYLLYDASADALKAIQSQNVVGAGMITSKDEITIGNVASNDVLLIYDTSAGALKKITKSAFDALQCTFSSVSPSNLLSGDGTGNYTIVVTGTDFDPTAQFKLKTDGGTDITMDSVTRDSATQLTGTVAKNKANLTNANEPFDIVVTNGNGLSATGANALNIDAQPVFSTAAGSLGSVANGARGSASFTVLAADPESGGDIVYTLESGSLPAGCSLASQSSGCVLSGFNAVGSNTTSNFTIRAKDAASNTTDRAFSISVLAPAYQTFTSSGTFTVPSGLTTVDVLVVAGGGAGTSQHSGGGGAGGLIYRPGFTVTPGATVTVTVGNGGAGTDTGVSAAPTPGNRGNSGQDSVFGTLTAKGGGGGGQDGTPGGPGGSGGGSSYQSSNAGSATQPTQSGESGNYGFGNAGGNSDASSPSYGCGGGGGAGAAGSTGNNGAGGSGDHPIGGPGGVGRAYTISDGTTSVYYAGGGGGASGNGNGSGSTSNGGNGGGGDGVTTGAAQAGTANRGGGGGGSDARSAPRGGGSGGKGVVIVAY